MGRRAATALHLGLILLGAVLYVVFVLPRWWVLTGDVPTTLATAGRIAAALPVGAAAVPVWLTLQQSMKPSLQTPELALRLRAWSAVLHVAAAVLIMLAAITEIWLSLEVGGPWLFGVYGAAAAITILAVAAFYLSFVAEKPPAPPKPPKATKVKTPKVKTPKKKGGKARETPRAADPVDLESNDEDVSTRETDTDTETETETETTVVEPAGDHVASPAVEDPETDDAEPAEPTEPTETSTGALRNKRLSGNRRHRLRR